MDANQHNVERIAKKLVMLRTRFWKVAHTLVAVDHDTGWQQNHLKLHATLPKNVNAKGCLKSTPTETVRTSKVTSRDVYVPGQRVVVPLELAM